MADTVTNSLFSPGPNENRAQSMTLAQAKSARLSSGQDLASFTNTAIGDKEVSVLARFLASRLQVPEFMAFAMLRKFVGTGQASSFTELKNFFREFVGAGGAEEMYQGFKNIFESLQRPEVQNKPDYELEQIFRPVVKHLQEQFAQFRETNNRGNLERFSKQQFEAIGLTRPQLTQLVSSPQAFASWLVNNKAAFLMLKTNPQLIQLLMALNNPNLAKSPVLLQEIYKMITQVIKLKRGRSQVEDFDDAVKENLNVAANKEAAEHEASIVHSLRQVTEQAPLGPLKDFLLEAERFAEEEIANMWSLALRKEKELEKKLGAGFQKLAPKTVGNKVPPPPSKK